MLFSTPFIRAIRNTFPEAYIACVTVPNCKELLEANSNINEIFVYDTKTLHKGMLKKWELILELRRRKFDVAFLLHRSLTRTAMCFLSGIKQRIGYSYKKRNFLLTHKVKSPLTAQHRIEYFLGLARKIGADMGDTALDFFTTKEDETYMDKLFKNNKIQKDDKLIAINPGGNWEPKRWPVTKYAELCDELIEKFGIKIIITGAPKDLGLYLRIQEKVESKLIAACGKTTLRQLGALFKRCDIVISGDSGPLHIALAVKKKVIALFGPTSPAITGPYGDGEYVVLQKDIDCKIPCYNVSCESKKCMNAVLVSEVVEQVGRMLRS